MKLDIFGILLKTLISVVKMFLQLMIPLFILLVIFIFLFLCHLFYLNKIKGIKKERSDVVLPKQPGFLKKLFWLLPRQLAYDYLTQDPKAFDQFGIHIVVGRQGAGKTMTAVYLMEEWRSRYPNLQIFTNFEYVNQNGSIDSWRDIIERVNGKYGVVNGLDEMKTFWSNKDSKDVPPDMLAEICQQRKQKKAILGTVQVFSELAKPFRSQTSVVYIPRTYFNSLTIVLKSKPEWYDPEKDRFKKYDGFFFFIQSPELRAKYDTYKKIERYKDQEFAKSQVFVSDAPSQTCEE